MPDPPKTSPESDAAARRRRLSSGGGRDARGRAPPPAAIWGAALLAAAFAGGGAEAQKAPPQAPPQATPEATPAPPDAVSIPTGLDFGLTSYFDAFGRTTPGLVLQGYLHHESLNEITGPDGRPAPGFRAPRIDVDVLLMQLLWIAREFRSGAIGLDLMQPIVNLNANFATPGAVLRDNGLGFGDTAFGPFYQSKPVVSGGRAIFDWRVEVEAIAPSGDFNSSKDLNQSAGFWSINPYLAVSYLPTPKLEVSARANYLYNLATTRAPNPAPLPGLPFLNGQAGQAVYLDFDASYQAAPGFSLGMSGYYLSQVSEDKYDGVNVPNSKKQALYIGPGFHWEASKDNILNANVHLPVENRNLPQGPKLSLQYIHSF